MFYIKSFVTLFCASTVSFSLFSFLNVSAEQTSQATQRIQTTQSSQLIQTNHPQELNNSSTNASTKDSANVPNNASISLNEDLNVDEYMTQQANKISNNKDSKTVELSDEEFFEYGIEQGLGVEFAWAIVKLYKNAPIPDYNKVVHFLTKAAELQDVNAMIYLGNLYKEGDVVKQDYNESLKWYALAANLGNGESANMIGNFYFKGLGVEKSNKQASLYYEKAIELGYTKAYSNLGKVFEEDKYYPMAANYYLKAIEANSNDDVAWYNLANLYCLGYGVPKDLDKASEYLRKSVYLGNAKAANTLGTWYLEGVFGEPNYQQAKMWFIKAYELGFKEGLTSLGLACERNNEYAEAITYYLQAIEQNNDNVTMYNLGTLYYNGHTEDGVVDYIEAKNWFEKSSNNGNADANVVLGIMYENGQGVKQDLNKAQSYYQKAINQGSKKAIFNLAILFKYGDSNSIDIDSNGKSRSSASYFKPNYSRAKQLLEQAIRNGDVRAYEELAGIYYMGLGITPNYREAKRLLLLAVNHTNSSKAYYNLAVMYYQGLLDNNKPNFSEALKYLNKADVNNYAPAQFLLGVMYLNGDGVQQNINFALEKIEQSKDNGYLDAYTKLANIYEEGKIVPKDMLKAKELYKVACEYGVTEACEFNKN